MVDAREDKCPYNTRKYHLGLIQYSNKLNYLPVLDDAKPMLYSVAIIISTHTSQLDDHTSHKSQSFVCIYIAL